ncbi:MAG: NADH-quinone oxidoreductase subunit L [Thermosulfidibacteraceae bacterium]|jgi:NADH-quinone oxidoreductase subunit L
MEIKDMALLVVLLPLVGAFINGVFCWKVGKKAHLIAVPAIAIPAVIALKLAYMVVNGLRFDDVVYWWITVGNTKIPIGFRLDELSTVMVVTVTFVATWIHIYSIGYMHEETDRGYAKYFSYLNLFCFFMLTLVLANNYVLLFVGWEGVGLCSYLLIGYWYEKTSAANAGLKAFITNRVGDFGFLIGLFVLYKVTGSLIYKDVIEKANLLTPEVATIVGLLLFSGATGKSAQIPLYVWLPDAMEGPTPVSALIHAATMVTAGVYMTARSSVIYSMAPIALDVIAVVGVATAMFAASMALVNNDLKRILAYSTVSQLGYMFVGVGVGAYSAGIFHLFTHAFFKGLLFLCSGSVMHALHGELDIQKMGGLYDKMKITALTFIVGALAIAGIPPLAGFWSKDSILHHAYVSGHRGIWLVGTITAGMTAFYMFRLIFLTFFGKPRDKHLVEHAHESPLIMTIPLIVLAIGSILVGFAAILPNGGFEGFVNKALVLREVGGHHEEEASFLIILSVVVALIGIGIAYSMYIKFAPDPRRLSQTLRPLYLLLYNKYYVDEIYFALFINPTVEISRWALWKFVDVMIIDGIVNGVANFFGVVSSVVRRIQTGYIPDYGWLVIIGVILICGIKLIF